MQGPSRILVETTHRHKEALTCLLEENGATLTEWFTDNIVEATADFSLPRVQRPIDLSTLAELRNPDSVFARLNGLNWAFADDDTTYLSHDIHPYPAKFIPQIPRNLIAQLSVPGEVVWDPFGGSGTTALESLLLNRQAISSDVNPIAQIIGHGKLLTLRKEDDDFLVALIEELSILTAAEPSVADALAKFAPLERLAPDIPNREKWFHPQAVAELCYLKARINEFASEACRRLGKTCLSKIILRSSFQHSETRYTCCERDFPPGRVVRLFAGALESSLKKVRYLGGYLRFREASFVTADLRRTPIVPPSSVDLIVTSPPYPNANDYHLYHRFRLFWLGFDPRELAKKEIGSHLRHQKEGTGLIEYLEEIEICLRIMHKGLRPGRFAVLVLGDCLFQGTVTHTAGIVSERAQIAGFEVVGQIERQLPINRRSFIATARRLRTESLLVLRKAPNPIRVQLFPPPYKLWPYEAELRLKETNHLLPDRQLIRMPDNSLVTDIEPFEIERLRRLTFSYAFEGSNLHRDQTWQAILENGDATRLSRRKDPKYVTHGIHAYKGKFYPQLARCLFNLAGLTPGQAVLDPFCGSGTVPLEAYLHGLAGIGFDMNPLAVRIAQAKTEILGVDPYLRDRLLAQFEQRVQSLRPLTEGTSFSEETASEIQSWFPPPVVEKLAALISAIRDVPEIRVRKFLEVLLSNIVRQVSQQDPDDLRIRRRAIPINDAPVFEVFGRHLTEQRRRLSQFASRSNKAPCKFIKPHIHLADSRTEAAFEDPEGRARRVEAVVTSPPYATALPYIDTDRLSLLLLLGMQSRCRSEIELALTGSREIRNHSRREIEGKIEEESFGAIASGSAKTIITEVYRRNRSADVGFRRKNMAALLYRYFHDLAKVLQNVDRCLNAGGAAFFVIGDSTTVAGGKEIRIRSADALKETGAALGWTLNEAIPITVTLEKRPHTRNSITKNEVIWFRKSG